MSKQQNRYNDEFKCMIVDLHCQEKTVQELMSEYGLSKATLYKWIKERQEIMVDQEQISDLEVKLMKAMIKELEMENDILKKAMTIFAKK
ncbi:transposase [Paenibacillus yanchengensis]|uniref:Transposase n=1 Tax=Paenibacillus yanchengensis TaxID=2035833 RepID=A0ABW4YJN1_9BACL